MDPERDEKRPTPRHEENGAKRRAEDEPDVDRDGEEQPPPSAYPPIVEYDD